MTSKQINNFIKQNDGMYMGLVNRSIEFNRIPVLISMTDEEKLTLLKEENELLKKVVQANKPPPQAKKVKEVIKEDVEEEVREKDIVHHTFTNLEDMKRAFFGNEIDSYLDMIKEHPFKFYKATYNYNDDNDGRATYMATNLLKGIVRNCEKMGKYAMIVFRCWKKTDEEKYKYESYWLLNSQVNIDIIANSVHEDFNFMDIPMNVFDDNFRRINEDTIVDDYIMLAETYIH